MNGRRHAPPRVVGRYAVFDVIASGGMATVHFGRLLGSAGFSRTVAIKRLHAQYAADAELVTMFLDEARVAARIRHPNVVAVVDIAADVGAAEVLLVMEYVHGESLAYLTRAQDRHEPGRTRVIGNVMAGALQGLHAAHEATGDNGKPLGVVHRDFSPQNILVGVDGTARVADFGVAKAAGQSHCTGKGQVKGKIRYLSPEQVTCGDVDRRSDLWSAAVVLWEALSGRRLFSGDHDAGVLMQVLQKPIPSLREFAPEVPESVARVVMRGLQRDRTLRYATALEMATALEESVGLLPAREVGAWVERIARGRLEERQRVLDDIEAETPAGVVDRRPEPPAVATAAGPRPAAQAFAVTTDVAMVRTSFPEAERITVVDAPPRTSRITWAAPLRAPIITWAAWTAAATLVLAIAGGVAAQILGHARPPAVIASSMLPATPPDAEAESALVLTAALAAFAPPTPASPPPAPVPSSSARVDPAHRPRAVPGRSRAFPGDPARVDPRMSLTHTRD
jgi:tRNA A-37 threonylcarbamoyl transferase component Bud32